MDPVPLREVGLWHRAGQAEELLAQGKDHYRAAPTVRTSELVYSAGKTEVPLSAETIEDIKKYVGLLGLVYGGLKLENADHRPSFLGQLPSVVGLI